MPRSRVLEAASLRAAAAVAALALATPALAQDSYEIQVYGSDLVPPRHTMFELHTNTTPSGALDPEPGVQPDEHAWHETLEVTHGVNDWLEVGFYVFTSYRQGDGWQWVGDHIRPRVSAPESWHWPVGVSLSQEIGYERREFSPDTWTWEIRPIVDQTIGRWYWSVNLSFDLALKGENAGRGFELSPAAKLSYEVSRSLRAGLEYYGGLGPVGDWEPPSAQGHQLFPSLDFDLSPDWELNVGAGFGLTRSSDRFVLKVIVGRRFRL